MRGVAHALQGHNVSKARLPAPPLCRDLDTPKAGAAAAVTVEAPSRGAPPKAGAGGVMRFGGRCVSAYLCHLAFWVSRLVAGAPS